jgi:NADH:ubiquinone oxidoreductase subunit D
MSIPKTHGLFELASAQGCAVLYCAPCDVTELRIGDFRVNIDPDSMKSLEAIIHQANQKLDEYKTILAHDALMKRMLKTNAH